MTRDEYAEKLRQMTAQELDAETATKVMEWKVEPSPFGDVYTTPCESATFEPHHYSSDIAAAWEIMEKMRKPGFSWHIEEDDKSGGWFVLYYYDGDELPEEAEWFIGEDNLLPRAICIAACLAVWEEEA